MSEKSRINAGYKPVLYIILILLLGYQELCAMFIVDKISDRVYGFRLNGFQAYLPYYSNKEIGESSEDVHRAIIAIHGMKRNAYDYYKSLTDAGVLAGEDTVRQVIFVPQFLIEADLTHHEVDSELLFWTNTGWRRGDRSESTKQHPRSSTISSFAVLDTLLLDLVTRYPKLEGIVIAGHSAGGQFVNRYAAGSPVIETIENKYQIPVRFLVSNPSSYLYFNMERVVPGTLSKFEIPPQEVVQECPKFNEYKYGLDNLNYYMILVGTDKIREYYGKREVIYLLGGADDDPEDTTLVTDCPAELQGSQRLERGKIYFKYLQHYYGKKIKKIQKLKIIPNTAHDQYGIFTSDQSLHYLFAKIDHQAEIYHPRMQTPKKAWNSTEAQQKITGKLGMEFVLIPGGFFVMGSPLSDPDSRKAERPQRLVTMEPFYLMTTEVTQAQWSKIMQSNPSHFTGENRPVEKVSWYDVQRFICRLNQMDAQRTYLLPTEAEWEYACRAGNEARFPWGDDLEYTLLSDYAWYSNNSVISSAHSTSAVGVKKPNPWGLYDMLGNVWEWCADPFHRNYKGAPSDGRVWKSTNEFLNRVCRGGSCYSDSTSCRPAARLSIDPFERLKYIGFRLICTPR